MGIQSCIAIAGDTPRSLFEGCLRSREGLLRSARGIDAGPAKRGKLIVLLRTRDRGVGIGCVAAAASDAGDAGIEIGDQKEAAKRHAERCGRSLDACALA